MGAHVRHGVVYVVVGQMGRVFTGGKAKLHHPHTGKARIIQKLYHVLTEGAQILCHYLALGSSLERLEQGHSGPLLPSALLGSLCRSRYRPIRSESAEMVYPHYIVQLAALTDASAPPIVAVLLHCRPVVKGVTPKLTFLREIIGRYARNLLRLARTLIKQKQMGVRPYIRRIAAYVDRHIAEKLYAQ